MVLSGLLAFVLVAAGLADRGEVVSVAVARSDIPAGTVVTTELVTSSELPADSPLAKTVATLEGLRGARWITAQPIPAGNPIRRSELAQGEQANTLRSMSIPVPREHAVGGGLAVGDRVDVIDVVEGRAAFVVAGAQVTKVATPSSAGGIAGDVSRQFFVVVQVDAHQALAITEALADGKVDVVRSTGAPPIGRGTATPGAGG
ncbi:MAG: SAF domain-containing protein [Actinomycetota bacterium]|nr:SAF domain-containing protein [Actinomycetota bacterium]